MAMVTNTAIKSLLFSFLLCIAVTPVFSEPITIDSAKLELIIQEEVAKAISTAVDEAVAVAVKAERLKYIDKLAGKDKIIADKQFEIDLLVIDKALLQIQKENIQITFDNYKKSHGIPRDLTIGGLSFSGGFMASFVVFLLTMN